MPQDRRGRSLRFALSLATIAALFASGPAHAAVTAKTDAKPSSAELAAARRALAGDFGETVQAEHHQLKIRVGHADLNGDGRPDLIIVEDDPLFCGSHGCSAYALLRTRAGYSTQPIQLAIFDDQVTVLDSSHKGMRNLRFDNSTVVFRWTGTAYKASASHAAA